MEIQGNSFLITGGGSGLGAGCARRLAAAGGHVLLADINADAGKRLADEIGKTAEFIETDVTDDQSVQRAVEAAGRAGGGLAGVVNCAGIALGSRVVGQDGPHDLGHFARVINVNLIGTFNVIRLAATAMSGRPAGPDGERGVIVNTASVAAFDGQIGQAAYSASKGGVVSMTLPIARELARFGIRVMTIAPGIFETPMMGGMPDKVRESLSRQMVFPQRMGTPEDFAFLVEHIMRNPMLNAEVIRLDGGIRMAAK
jgi:NAD(P)-dependent dehydrogenase (short-subunit alcohol dehydrogenase family)